MKTDSWGRPIEEIVEEKSTKSTKQLQFEFTTPNEDVARQPGMIWAPKPCTPEEQAEWFQEDFFMKGDFDVMKLFVLVPAVIQVVVFGMMLAVMLLNQYIF